MNGLTPDQWIFLFIAYIGAMIVLIMFLKIKGRGLSVCILKPTGEFEVKKVKREGLFLKFTKNWKPTFKPRDIFIENKPAYAFWRGAKSLLFIVENGRKALSWKKRRGKNPKNPGDKLLMELRDNWTLSEYREFAKKEAIQAQIQAKPMSNMQFTVLSMLIVVTLLMIYLGFNRIGAF